MNWVQVALDPRLVFWAWQIRHLHRLPSDIDLDNLLVDQQHFLVLLTGAGPSAEGLTLFLREENELLEIKNKDYIALVRQEMPQEALENLARVKGLTTLEYVQERAHKMREDALAEYEERQKQKKLPPEKRKPISPKIDRNPPLLGSARGP